MENLYKILKSLDLKLDTIRMLNSVNVDILRHEDLIHTFISKGFGSDDEVSQSLKFELAKLNERKDELEKILDQLSDSIRLDLD